jgi:L-threonylcarbamoyladenylate synthase
MTISEAAQRIRAGDVVAFPTETVYGLGANALDANAVEKIFAVKGRPKTSPLIVHVSSIEMAQGVVADWPALADELAARWWPGPLSLVLPKRTIVPDVVTAGLPTVGVRVPANPTALALIREAGVPIAAPSANLFTGLSATTAAHVRQAFGDRVAVLDGGPCTVGIESTVVAIQGDKLKLLRPGMISLGEIEKVAAREGVPHPAPGMHERHYSPRTRLIVLADPGSLPEGRGAWLWREHSLVALTPTQTVVHVPSVLDIPSVLQIRMPIEPNDYAAKLYSTLHDLDRQKLDWIAVEAPPTQPEWAAILDRLTRASDKV